MVSVHEEWAVAMATTAQQTYSASRAATNDERIAILKALERELLRFASWSISSREPYRPTRGGLNVAAHQASGSPASGSIRSASTASVNRATFRIFTTPMVSTRTRSPMPPPGPAFGVAVDPSGLQSSWVFRRLRLALRSPPSYFWSVFAFPASML